MQCSHCKKKLNSGMIIIEDSQGIKYKTCPKCSKANGSEHVFHRYPESFGTTIARKNYKNHDGHQSYCESCRGLKPEKNSVNFVNGLLCNQL